MSGETAQKIIREAEDMIRSSGYQSFSFRDIAAAIGIKSSSVHYHFPTKGDLAEAVASNYDITFFNALNELSATATSTEEKLKHYVDMFRRALTVDNKLCLCGMLGASSPVLPDNVLPKVDEFFQHNIEWLIDLQIEAGAEPGDVMNKARASTLLAALEGSMIVAQSTKDQALFEQMLQQSAQQFLNAIPNHQK